MRQIGYYKKELDRIRSQIRELRRLERSSKTSPWRRKTLPGEIIRALIKKEEIVGKIRKIEGG